jgi:hypothetical protein
MLPLGTAYLCLGGIYWDTESLIYLWAMYQRALYHGLKIRSRIGFHGLDSTRLNPKDQHLDFSFDTKTFPEIQKGREPIGPGKCLEVSTVTQSKTAASQQGQAWGYGQEGASGLRRGSQEGETDRSRSGPVSKDVCNCYRPGFPLLIPPLLWGGGKKVRMTGREEGRGM